MSFTLDNLMYVNEKPWSNLGTYYETPPSTPHEIVRAAQMDWRVNTDKMFSALYPNIPNYYAVYREDNSDILGVVNKARPQLVQNIDAFNAFEDLIGKEVTVETAASLGKGEKIFGCFEIKSEFTVLGDEVKHYFVVVNEHLKADGKVTILNTPIRVVCQNTLSQALSKNDAIMRIPISDSSHYNSELARQIIAGADHSIKMLNYKAEKLATQKVSDRYVETVLDELFPFVVSSGDESLHEKANQKVEMMRESFMNECMDADDVQNFKGSKWWIFNALTNFTQHAHKNVDKAYDLNYRMTLVPGLASSESPIMLVNKYLKIMDKIAA